MLTNLFNNLKFALDYIFDWFNLSVNFEINTNCVIFFYTQLFCNFSFSIFFLNFIFIQNQNMHKEVNMQKLVLY